MRSDVYTAIIDHHDGRTYVLPGDWRSTVTLGGTQYTVIGYYCGRDSLLRALAAALAHDEASAN